MSTNAERFGEIVKARREELDLTQLDVWQAGGPSNTKLTEIENGRLRDLSRVVAKRLDEALHWEAGSAKRAYKGGDPIPALPRASNKRSAHLRELIGLSDDIDETTRAELMRVLDERGRGA